MAGCFSTPSGPLKMCRSDLSYSDGKLLFSAVTKKRSQVTGTALLLSTSWDLHKARGCQGGWKGRQYSTQSIPPRVREVCAHEEE